MQNLLQSIESKLSRHDCLNTPAVRKIGREMYQNIKNHSFEKRLQYCEALLEERKWAYTLIAFDWAYRGKKHFTEGLFPRFETWLFDYVRDWGDCDDFCTHAFGELLKMYPSLYDRVFALTTSEHFWVRRAAAVVFILPIRRGVYDNERLFKIAEALMHDEHYLVLKGYGWMLKVLSEHEKESVVAFLEKHRETMPRLAYRYALEKTPPKERARLMR